MTRTSHCTRSRRWAQLAVALPLLLVALAAEADCPPLLPLDGGGSYQTKTMKTSWDAIVQAVKGDTDTVLTYKYADLVARAQDPSFRDKSVYPLIAYTGEGWYDAMNNFARAEANGEPDASGATITANCSAWRDFNAGALAALQLIKSDADMLARLTHVWSGLQRLLGTLDASKVPDVFKATQEESRKRAEGIAKLQYNPTDPLYRGVFFNGLGGNVCVYCDYFERNVRLGAIVTEPAFASTARKGVPTTRQATTIRYVIDNAANGGRRIADISLMGAKSDENEILFPPGQQFRITRIEVEDKLETTDLALYATAPTRDDTRPTDADAKDAQLWERMAAKVTNPGADPGKVEALAKLTARLDAYKRRASHKRTLKEPAVRDVLLQSIQNGVRTGNFAYNKPTLIWWIYMKSLRGQTVSFLSIAPSPARVKETYDLSATASSDLLVTFTTPTPTVCTVAGAVVTFTTAGTCRVEAIQMGDDATGPARAEQSITVSP